MESLQEIKDKLKKVSNAWTEINSLSSTAIYDINDTNVNWNKKVVLEDVKDIVDKRIHIETPAPTKKDETKPKLPKKLSVIGMILIIFFGLSMISCSTIFFAEMSLYYRNLLLPYIFNIIAFAILTTGICFKIYYKNQCSYSEIKSLPTPNKKFNIVAIILIVLGCLCLFFHLNAISVSTNVNIDTDIITQQGGNDLFIIYLCSIPFTIFICIGVCLVFSKNNSYNLRLLKYQNNLNIIEENIKYNNEQYPKDLEEYNKNYLNLCNEQVRKINATHKKIGEYFNKIAEIDIVSTSQAKYAQTLLDYIYKGATNIKEAFEKLESEKEKVDKQIEEQNQKIKGIANKVYERNTNNEKNDNNTNSKSKWKRLSKLAKSAIIVPIITIGLPIIWFIISSILQSKPENINALVGMTMIMNIISYVLIGGTAVFESVTMGILCYRKFRKDFKGK